MDRLIIFFIDGAYRLLAILIRRQLTIEQYIKLFSNPVSGLVCEVDAYNRDHRVKYHVKNIRYSKSMILRALKFWLEYTAKYYAKISRIYNPLIDIKSQFEDVLSNLRGLIIYIKKQLPDSFLFSHRHIEKMTIPNEMKSHGLQTQGHILAKKYKQNIVFQKGTLQPYWNIGTDIGIEFTVFPCEHPYIPRQKISKVGITDKGNVYILYNAEKKKKK